MTETTATSETKRTRFTVNQALAAVLSFIEGYIIPFDEEKLRARYASMKPALDPEMIEQCIASQKRKAESKVNLAETDAKKVEAYSIFTSFYAEEAKVRERVTLPSILEPLALKGTDQEALWFTLESFVVDQENRKAEALKKLAAAKK